MNRQFTIINEPEINHSLHINQLINQLRQLNDPHQTSQPVVNHCPSASLFDPRETMVEW